MSWLFSQALVEACLADTCSAGARSVQLSGSHTQQVYLPPDRMTAFSRPSRFGMMFKPLTESRGETLLMWYLEDFRAKTLALPEKALELTGSDQACGSTWRASLAKFDPSTSLWKTAQHCLLGDSDESSVIWPRSGMTANGQCWELPMLERRTSGTDSGLWATPTVCGNYNRKGASKTSGDGLATRVMRWPTPCARDYKGANSQEGMTRKDGKSRADQLPNAVQVAHGQPIGGSLNPTWVEWLMGWPLGWTDLKPLEMDKFRQWQKQHSVG